MARAMKDSGIEWIGEIPEGWKVSPVKNYIKWKSEKGYPEAQVLSLYRDFGIIPKDSRDDNHNVTSLDISGYKYVEVGDLVINKMKAWQGSIAVSNYSGIVSPAYHVCQIVGDGIYKQYLHYLLRNPAYLPEYMRLSTGMRVGQWDLGFDDFKNIPIVLPDMLEQKRIVSFLDAECARIDAVVEQTRASIEEYKKLKQSVITQAVTKGIRPGRKMKDSGIKWVGDIPNDWKLLSLGAVTESMRNGYVGPTKDLFVDEGVKYIQSLHIKDGKIDFSRQRYYVSEEWANVHPKIKENDVLIVQTGDIGSVGLVTAEYDGCNCHALIIATPRTDLVFPQYLTFFLRSTVGKELLLFYKTGALLPHLNSGKIKFASICVPSLQEQKEIANYLKTKCLAIDNLISKKELFLAELESYKKSLIFEYVTGKKEVQA